MTRIYCTKKLQDFVGNVENNLPADFSNISINDWNAHLFYLDKKKCLVFVNNLTFYTVFLLNVLKKDIKNLDPIFSLRLKEQLIHDEIINNSESVDKVFPNLEMKLYRTNNNKKVIGRINDFTSIFKHLCFYQYENFEEIEILYENGLINSTPTGNLMDLKKSWNSAIANVKQVILAGE